MKTKEKTKEKSKETSKKSPDKKTDKSKDSPPKNSINNNNINIQKPQNPDKFPKNVNEFRHIMDDVTCCRADIEFMLELRRHKKIQSIEKSVASTEPPFYQDDLTKYRNRFVKKSEEKRLLQTNIGTFRQLFSDRTKYAINDPTYRYEVCLRTEPNLVTKSTGKSKEESKNVKKKVPWNSTICPKEKSLFDTLLPPVLQPSRELFAKYENKIGRPVVQIKKDGFINGEKVKSRIFDYNSFLASRFPAEHYPSSKYSNDYGVQNVNAIRHLLNSDNRTMTSYWSTYLRGDKKKKFLPEETKRREKRLRDRSNERSPKG